MVSCAPAFGAGTYTTSAGQPFCTNDDQHAREYNQALQQHDQAWLDSLSGCRQLAAGLKVVILRTYPEPDGVSPVVKIRVYGNGGSEVGYTISGALRH